MDHSTVEIKARCADPEGVRAFLHEQAAVYKGRDHQVDTYFSVNQGLLKLRQGTIENNLIYYDRQSTSGPKKATVMLAATEHDTPLKDMLTTALGMRVTVDKNREIFFLDNVKFHIDEVKDLGAFVEIEAQSTSKINDETVLRAQCVKYMRLLNIKDEELIAHSYSDLMLAQRQKMDKNT